MTDRPAGIEPRARPPRWPQMRRRTLAMSRALIPAVVRLGAALLALAALLLPAAPAWAQGGARHALVIGNSAYRHAPALANPANDARDVCASLKRLGFQTTCPTDVKTRGEFKDLVQRFAGGVKAGDVILFYFAGHGIEMEGENYLVPTTADFRSRGTFEDESVRVNYILDELAGTGSRLSIVILDACRDNPFGARARSAVGTGLAIPSKAPAGSIIIFPTSPGRTALDGGSGGGRNGLFTRHLLSHLETRGIEVETMFKRVIEGVKFESEKIGQQQIPWMNLSFTGEYCFAGCVDRQAEAREREGLAQRARELEAQLGQQQRQADEFRNRMKEMETRLVSQQKNTETNSAEYRRLEAERAELQARVLQLENQDQGIKRAQQSLSTLRRNPADLKKVEQELAARERRLNELDGLLTARRSTSDKGPGARELAALRKERDELQHQVNQLRAEKESLVNAQQELAKVEQFAREAEASNRELARYRERLAAMERDAVEKDRQLAAERALRAKTEAELKDAHKSAVKGAATVSPSF